MSLLILLIGCTKRDNSLFTKLTTDETGIYFENTIKSNLDLNIIENPLLFNGGGVGIGDINNDGLPDILLAGNMVSSRLYLNKGNMKFEDITESAGITTDKWITGVSMIDINNDDYLDIYLSVVGLANSSEEKRRNLLFINNGDNTFIESSKDYGIDDSSFTTHATFLDYNKDGHLDLFLLNHSPGSFYSHMVNIDPDLKNNSDSDSYDKLYRNNGNGTFTDVSNTAGIVKSVGYGLGVVVNDFNRDGWPDIYVSNDLVPDDVLYINNQDGTFSNKLSEYLKQTSFAGMGVDASDFNNDGWPDIVQVDMMPKDLKERKLMSGAINFDHFSFLREKGYDYSYSKNTLQLNQGIHANDKLIFSEISRLAGVAYTNWSWGALFGDYNNDGLKDIFISNGYPKAVNNYDYISKLNNAGQFGTQNAVTQQKLQIMQELHSIKQTNKIFRNGGDLKFTDVSEQWGFREPSYSYGVAHADLNNDGSLDIVINNINAPASIYKNNLNHKTDNHYIQIDLEGSARNRQGIGAKLRLTSDQQKQYIYHTLWRGYQSTVNQQVHFGLGKSKKVDSLQIVWPDGRTQLLTELPADQQITLRQKDATIHSSFSDPIHSTRKQLFNKADQQNGLEYKHRVRPGKVDYQIQPLLPYMISHQGPPLAVGDINGNGLDDVFIGGSRGFSGQLFFQNAEGGFDRSTHGQPWQNDTLFNDWGAKLFDANDDGFLDLYVASGGYQVSPDSELLQDRLYINTGEGRFIRDNEALPKMLTSTAKVAVADFTGDGKPDLFVGGRLTPLKYPYPTRSWLLENLGGKFKDVTSRVAPDFIDHGGMITDAVWLDFNGDSQVDLVTVGEWMPIKFYENRVNRFYQNSQAVNPMISRGWWYSLEKGDFNEDGMPDLIAGNLGQNFTYTTSKDKPFGIFASDFNRDMTSDIILSVREGQTYYPFFGKATYARELRSVNSRFPTFQSFAEASLSDILGVKALEKALHYTTDTFASVYLQNKGKGKFAMTELPKEAQFSAIMGLVSEDIDRDGHKDVILAGNMLHTAPQTSRNDASNGIWLKGNGQGKFDPVPSFKSGLYVPKDVKGLQLIDTSKGKALLVANYDDSLQVFLIKTD